MDNLIAVFIKNLQNLPIELTLLVSLAICILCILMLFKFFGQNGLYLYNIVAVLAANIQILRGIKLSFSSKPIALGTIVFASTYLCSSILTEHFGQKSAKTGIWLCFVAQILMSLLMIIAVGHRPLSKDAISIGAGHMLMAEKALYLIFVPSPRLLLASLVSFVISQFIGIWSFAIINKITGNKLLWLRTISLLTVSTVVDTFVFNMLAWKLLSNNPTSFSVIFSTYILWTLVTQSLIIILSTPTIYISRFFKNAK